MTNVYIGTPIHECKDYGMKRWIQSLKDFIYQDWFLHIVDNSPTDSYINKVEEYFKEIGISSNKYKIDHIENMKDKPDDYKMGVSRELIREAFLKTRMEYFFSSECDTISPKETIETLIHFIKDESFDSVNHDYPDRTAQFDRDVQMVGGIGCSMFSRKVIEKLSWMENGGYGQCDPINPNCYFSNDGYFGRREVRNKFRIMNLINVLDIKHLSE